MPESVPQNLVEGLEAVIKQLEVYNYRSDNFEKTLVELKNCKDMAVEIRDFMERND